jgi:hypothetical protein
MTPLDNESSIEGDILLGCVKCLHSLVHSEGPQWRANNMFPLSLVVHMNRDAAWAANGKDISIPSTQLSSHRKIIFEICQKLSEFGSVKLKLLFYLLQRLTTEASLDLNSDPAVRFVHMELVQYTLSILMHCTGHTSSNHCDWGTLMICQAFKTYQDGILLTQISKYLLQLIRDNHESHTSVSETHNRYQRERIIVFTISIFIHILQYNIRMKHYRDHSFYRQCIHNIEEYLSLQGDLFDRHESRGDQSSLMTIYVERGFISLIMNLFYYEKAVIQDNYERLQSNRSEDDISSSLNRLISRPLFQSFLYSFLQLETVTIGLDTKPTDEIVMKPNRIITKASTASLVSKYKSLFVSYSIYESRKQCLLLMDHLTYYAQSLEEFYSPNYDPDTIQNATTLIILNPLGMEFGYKTVGFLDDAMSLLVMVISRDDVMCSSVSQMKASHDSMNVLSFDNAKRFTDNVNNHLQIHVRSEFCDHWPVIELWSLTKSVVIPFMDLSIGYG